MATVKSFGAFVGAAAAMLALSACVSHRSSSTPDDCLCQRVWVPPHCDSRVAYCVEPAKTHVRDLPVMGLCEQVERRSRCVPVTTPVAVTDTCTKRVPTVECECLPRSGYHAVPDTRDVLVPVCAPRCIPEYRDVDVADFEDRCDRCGRTYRVPAGCHVESRYVGDRVVCKKVGERLETEPAGSHIERCPACGGRCTPVVVGEHEGTFETGIHYEQVPVGWKRVVDVDDLGVRARQVGTRTEVIETMPWRYEGYEQPVTVPGFCATVCDDPRHHHSGIVLTSGEYAEFLKAAAR